MLHHKTHEVTGSMNLNEEPSFRSGPFGLLGHRWLGVGHFPRYFVDKGHQLVSLGAVFHFRSMKPWLVRFPVSAAA